jgi:hypothetical protein
MIHAEHILSGLEMVRVNLEVEQRAFGCEFHCALAEIVARAAAESASWDLFALWIDEQQGKTIEGYGWVVHRRWSEDEANLEALIRGGKLPYPGKKE